MKIQQKKRLKSANLTTNFRQNQEGIMKLKAT